MGDSHGFPFFPIRMSVHNFSPTKVEGLPQHDAILMLLAHKSQDPGQSLSFMFLDPVQIERGWFWGFGRKAVGSL